MQPTLTSIWRYPVKGLGGTPEQAVDVIQDQRMPGDRRFAFLRHANSMDPAHPEWQRRHHFLMLAQDAWLAGLSAAFDPAQNILSLKMQGDESRFPVLDNPHFRMEEASERHRLEVYIQSCGARLAGHENATRLIDGGLSSKEAIGFTDSSHATLSIINRQTVRDIGEKIGRDIDIRRFRGNLIIDAEPAWCEFDWLERHFTLGSAAFQVFRRIDRCAATTVNPETGARDIQIPKLLQYHYGHVDCGVHVRVTQSGSITANDRVAFTGQSGQI